MTDRQDLEKDRQDPGGRKVGEENPAKGGLEHR